MKNIIMLSLFVLTTACGKYATKDELKSVENRIDDVEHRIGELDNKIMHNLKIMGQMHNHFQSQIDQAAVELDASDDKSEASQNTALAMIRALQDQTTELAAKQAALELEDRVIGVFDPCPNFKVSSFTESVFQMKSGKFVAYFEDGGKRFLSVLKTGTTYRTTDSRACTFTI